MNNIKIIFSVIFTLIIGSLNAQNISGVINTYARVTSISGNTFSIDNVSGAIGDLGAGQKVLIIQMKGATIERANTIDYGTLLSLNDAGNHEYAIINSIAGYGPTYTLTVHNLLKTYDASSFVQIISVPQYDNVTVNGELTAAPWNRSTGTGGVLALEVAGILNLAANIDVSGKGFAGGSVNPTQFGGSTDAINYVTTSNQISGQKGEGIAIYGSEGQYAMGPLANGGGGGNSHNAGGGGGGNFSAGGLGGESHYGPGGNGMGGKQIIADPLLNKLFMGGGGGGGQENNSNASPGGAGGGLILIRANQITSDCMGVRGLRANGANASNTTGNDGAGGGGAGGTILLDVSVFNLTCNIDILTNGGTGGSVTISQKHAGGGGGGAGAILLPGSTANAFTNIGSLSGASGIDCTTCGTTGSPGEVCSGDACAGDGSWPDLPNSSPVAVDDNILVPKNTNVSIELLINDRDADFGDVISVSSIITPPSNGSLTPIGDTFTYTPNPNFAGTDFFTYEICDNGSPMLCNSATVTITVNSILLNNIEADPLSYTEGQSSTPITATTTISHISAAPLESVEVKIATNYLATEDLLAFTNTATITGTWDTSGGVLTLTGTASIAEYQAALRSISYTNTNSDNPSDLVRTVSMRAFDGTDYSNIATRTISIIPVNDLPLLSALETTALAFTEGDAAKTISSSIVINDVDNANLSYAYVWFDANYVNTEDVLAFTDAYGITGSWNVSTGLLSLSGSASLADYQAALRSVTYRNTNNNNPSTLTRKVTFTVHDDYDVGNKPSRNVVITAINDSPVLAAVETSTLPYTEGDAAKIITATITATDVDHANLSSAEVRITANYLPTEDILGFADQNGIVGSWDSSTGTLTLTGNATKASYQTALRSVTYLNSNTNNPSASTRTVTFEINDGVVSSNSVSRNITVTTVNDAPELAAIETTALSFTEGNAAKTITNTLTVSDVDHANLSGAEINISANYLSTEDVLTFVDANSISGSWDAATGTLTLTGLSTIANYQEALRSITYQNTNGNNPSGTTRTVSLTMSDGLLTSNTVTRNIEVVPVNDAPVLATIEPLALSFTEGDAATALTATITLSDADNNNMSGASITISGNYIDTEDVLGFTNANGITGIWNATTGTLTLSGAATIAHYQTAFRSITYHNINGDNPSEDTRTVSLMCSDGQLNSNIVTRDINVVAVNDAPILAAIETSTLSFNEGEPAKAISTSLTVNDVDNINISGASLEITANYVSTEDALSFIDATGIAGNWDAATGVLTLSGNATLAQYQAAIRSITYQNTNVDDPSGATRTVSVTINDGNLNSNVLTRDISVIPVNDAPQIANLETFAISFTEGDAATFITENITNTDVDNADLASAEIQITANYLATEDVLAFTDANGISGSWDATSGKLILTGATTIEQYQTALRAVTYQNINDEKPSVLTRTISLAVSDGALKSNVLTREIEIIPINDAPVTDDDIAVTDKNVPVVINVLENDFDVEGDNLAVTEFVLTIPSNGTLELNTDNTFTYTPDFNFFGTDLFEYQVCDDGDPAACASALVSITINYKNYSPVAEDDLIDILEDETIIIEVLTNDSDPDLDEINVSATIISAPKYGKVVLEGNKYTYTPNLNYNGSDSFEYEICDNGTPSICTTALVDIYIDPVNDAPEPVDDEYRNKDVIAEIKGNVLDNDYDIEADVLSVDVSTLVLPEHGQLTMKIDGTFSYIPNPGFFGQDSFQYFACDDGDPTLCTQATVVLRVSSGVPKGFSPNGDNTNDEWIISGLEEFPTNTVVVFNRYGDIVYEIKGYDNSSRVWRGEVNRGIKLGSGDLPDGTYFYVIDFGDGQSAEKGFVMIKR